MATFHIKEGDISQSIAYVLSPDTIDLTGASVRFNMADRRCNVKINRASATITDNGTGAAGGTPTVQYDWQTADTDTSGVYIAEWEVTCAERTVESFPHDGYISVEIDEDIA